MTRLGGGDGKSLTEKGVIQLHNLLLSSRIHSDSLLEPSGSSLGLKTVVKVTYHQSSPLPHLPSWLLAGKVCREETLALTERPIARD